MSGTNANFADAISSREGLASPARLRVPGRRPGTYGVLL